MAIFPEYQEPVALDANLSWIASFDSYNQRTEDIYYAITVIDACGASHRFIAQVGLDPAFDDVTTRAFVVWLQDELHRVATTGITNTTYRGIGG